MKFAKNKKKREKKMVTNQQKSPYIFWYHEQGTPKKNPNKAPDVKTIKSWSKKFEESGS